MYTNEAIRSLCPKECPKDIVNIVFDYMYGQYGLSREVANGLTEICEINEGTMKKPITTKQRLAMINTIFITYLDLFGKNLEEFILKNGARLYFDQETANKYSITVDEEVVFMSIYDHPEAFLLSETIDVCHLPQITKFLKAAFSLQVQQSLKTQFSPYTEKASTEDIKSSKTIICEHIFNTLTEKYCYFHIDEWFVKWVKAFCEPSRQYLISKGYSPYYRKTHGVLYIVIEKENKDLLFKDLSSMTSLINVSEFKGARFPFV